MKSKSTKEKLADLLKEYGGIALGTYLVIFALVFAGFAIALAKGFEVEGAAGSTGTLFGAWAATKLTQPLRIAATLLLTPIIGKLRPKKRPPEDPQAL
jgi:hypothetical protein